MLITAAQAILLQIPCEQRSPQPALYGRPWRTLDTLLLRVETDAGITGWGEAFAFHGGLTTRAALDSLVIPNLIGRDPSQIVPLMNDLQRRLHLYGRTGPVACALSAVDIALWDINGKMAGMPLFRMLGGSTRTHLPAYASLLRTGDPAHASRSVCSSRMSAIAASRYSPTAWRHSAPKPPASLHTSHPRGHSDRVGPPGPPQVAMHRGQAAAVWQWWRPDPSQNGLKCSHLDTTG